MEKYRLKKEEVDKYFKRTMKIIKDNDFIELHSPLPDRYSDFCGFDISKRSENPNYRSSMAFLSGGVRDVFSYRTVMGEDVKIYVSTYSGDRELEEMEYQVNEISRCLKVIKELEKVYNEERVAFREYYNGYEDALEKEREHYSKKSNEFSISHTEGDTSIFEVDGMDAENTFRAYLHYYVKQAKNQASKDSILLKNPKKGEYVLVAKKPAVYFIGKGQYGIRLNHFGVDVCNRKGEGVREAFRRGEHQLTDIPKIISKVFTNESKEDVQLITMIVQNIFDGKKDRVTKQKIRGTIKKSGKNQ